MSDLERLQQTVITCTRCPRLVEHRQEVAVRKRRMYMNWEYWGRPLPSFGDPRARVLILGLAPAAHGGIRTGRMFTGDRSGDWLYSTLHKFGFASSPYSSHRDDGQTLYDAYITAALRCAPPLNKPLPQELSHCRTYLLRELELLDRLEVVVALGKIAFDTYLGACRERGVPVPSPQPKFGHGVVYTLGDERRLLGSYHPSQQNTQTGRLTKEMFENVFATVRTILAEAQSG